MLPPRYASRTMMWSGPIVAAFVIFHVLHLTVGAVPACCRRSGPNEPECARQRDRRLPESRGLRLLHPGDASCSACTCITASGACSSRSGFSHPRYTPRLKTGAAIFAILIAIGNISIPVAVLAGLVQVREKRQHGTQFESSLPVRSKRVGPAPLRPEAGEPGQQAQVHHHRGGLRPGRRRRPRRRWPSSATTSSASASRIRPRRAHCIAAQGGINAAKNYQNDGDSIYRLFYDTVKGGDFRAREANVYRLAQISVNIIDQCVAQGVPFAREYGGYLDNRSLRRRAGVAHVLRARPDRPAAAARRLPGARAADRRRARCRCSRAPRCST